MPRTFTKAPVLMACWIIIGAFLNCIGWVLSALHQLNILGYSAAFVIGLIFLGILWRKSCFRFSARSHLLPLRRRFRRSFPLAFLVVTLLAVVGGMLYAPSNYDALAYRVPRILHWLAAEQWHWIHTDFNRLNTRAVGFEWLAAPLMVFTKTDRFLFLINVMSFLFLPGLFFSILTRLGVRPRVAWYWMWILPTGYSYVLQAGSIGNDLFGATFALAALDMALRARTSKSYSQVWLSVLAAALLSGSKLSNLPLLLPWLIAFLPSVRLLKAMLIPALGIGLVAVGCSFLPMGAVNYYYCHDWTGFIAEHSPFNQAAYGLHLTHNTLLLASQNFVPPVFPFANAWNQMVMKIMPPGLKLRLESNFEPSQAHLVLGEVEIEEAAGMGFGVCVLLALSLCATVKLSNKDRHGPRKPPDLARWAILVAPVFSLAVFMAKSGLATEARLATPYYGLVVPLLLVSESHARIVKARWWRMSAFMVFLLAGMLLVISPARPLWPAQYILSSLQSPNPLLTRAKKVYSVYSQRADGFAPVRQVLSDQITTLGLISADDPEASLWRPFGSRRIEHVTSADTPEVLRQKGITYVLVNSEQYAINFKAPLGQWLADHDAELVRTIPLTLRASGGPVDWLLVKIKQSPSG